MAIEIKSPKKLIEVALPLDAINRAASREKSIRHGHPSTLHLWWARRPLAAARAVVFAQLVNDPGYERYLGRGINKQKAQEERERLFRILEQLVVWENTNNEELLSAAREEIWKSWRETCALNKDHPNAKSLFDATRLPVFHDPFAGGGAIPLEAQRLGLDVVASDLNPVAVIINKAMIEIPPRFPGSRPVGPVLPDGIADELQVWSGARGLAEDVRRYGAWMRDEAFKKIGFLYPSVEISNGMVLGRPDLKTRVGESLTVIAWLWARTVRKCPNPVCGAEMPLIRSFAVSTKEKNERWLRPVVDRSVHPPRVHFEIDQTNQTEREGTVENRSAFCLACGSSIPLAEIRKDAKLRGLGVTPLAIVAESKRGREYISFPDSQVQVAISAKPSWKPTQKVTTPSHDVDRLPMYGMNTWGDAFSVRQLTALSAFSDLLNGLQAKVFHDAKRAGLPDDKVPLASGGKGALAYSEAIRVYLALSLDKCANLWSTVCSWMSDRGALRETFARQAIPMVWDFAEANPFSDSGGNFLAAVEKAALAITMAPANGKGTVLFGSATATSELIEKPIVSTDPPYYDNIGYADLSDFFYVWLKRSLEQVFPNEFSTPLVEKAGELVASVHRHGSKKKAELFFLDGMTAVMSKLAESSHPGYPLTIYYAFKQAEKTETGVASTGWETFLAAVLKAGFSITGTWPIRTEGSGRLVAKGTNALASSVVLVCRRRPLSAPTVSRREFIRELNAVLPEAFEEMTTGGDHSPVAPVDLSQAIIGPGMAIFSKYSAVLEADGKPMEVKTALQLINRFLAQDDFDHDTQFCLSWFDGHGWDQGKFGEADVLARAKGTSVDGLREGGIVDSSGGNLRLVRATELPKDWEVDSHSRVSVWELLHHMIRRLLNDGESGAAAILVQSSRHAETIRTLAYRLYTLCERKGWAQDAGNYNALVIAWEGMESVAQTAGYTGVQSSLFGEDQPEQSTKEKPHKRTGKKT